MNPVIKMKLRIAKRFTAIQLVKDRNPYFVWRCDYARVTAMEWDGIVREMIEAWLGNRPSSKRVEKCKLVDALTGRFNPDWFDRAHAFFKASKTIL